MALLWTYVPNAHEQVQLSISTNDFMQIGEARRLGIFNHKANFINQPDVTTM